MATLQYSQGGITNDVLEDLRRRQRERGERAPYRPAMDGLSEQDTEQAINRAQVGGQDAGDAVQDVRQRAQFQLRAPMTDTEPMQAAPMAPLRAPMTGTPAVQDYAEPRPAAPMAPAGPKPGMSSAQVEQGDRDAMERARRQSRTLRAVNAITTLFGDRSQDASRAQAFAGALESVNPMQYQERIDARTAQRGEQAAGKDAAAIEDEERDLNTDYRRTLMRSMDTNANRREFEMGRVGQREERNYDPASPTAAGYRSVLARVIASHPTTQAAFGSLDTTQMGARDLQGLADRVLRLRSQIPNRDRGVDDEELAAIVAGLDDTGEEVPAEVAAEVEPPAVQAARALRARRTGGAAPAAGAPAPAPEAGAAPRRDRTISQILADRMMEQQGSPPPSGYSSMDRTPGEALMIARDLARRGNRSLAARLAGGIDTQSREAQNVQTQSAGGFATSQDLARVERVARPLQHLARETDAAIREYERLAGGPNRPLTQAQFESMLRGGPAARLMGTDGLSSLARTFTNVQLHEQTGSAQTTGETQRFFSALNMTSLADPAQFYAAMRRARRAALADLNSIRSSNPAAYERLRGGRQ